MADLQALISLAVTVLGGTTLLVSQADEAPSTPPFEAPVAASAQPAAPSAGTLVIAKDPLGLFFLEGEVNRTPVRFLIDTGANVTVLTRQDAQRAGVLADRPGKMLATAGGKVAFAHGTAREIDLGDRRFRDVSVAIGGGLPHSVLGLEALSQLGEIRIAGDRLEIRAPAPSLS